MKKKILFVFLLTIVILFLNNFVIPSFFQLPQYNIPFDLQIQSNNDGNIDQGERILIDNEYIDVPIACPAVYTQVGWPMIMITSPGSCSPSSYHPIGIIANVFLSSIIAMALVAIGGKFSVTSSKK